MTMTPEFKNAKLFSCQEEGVIRHHDPRDAIQELMEDDWEDDEPITEQCERIGEVTVAAFNPVGIPDGWVEAQVELFMDRFAMDFESEFGCDEFSATPWPSDDGEWAKKVLIANLTKSLRSAETYNVEPVCTHTYSVEECIEILK